MINQVSVRDFAWIDHYCCACSWIVCNCQHEHAGKNVSWPHFIMWFY